MGLLPKSGMASLFGVFNNPRSEYSLNVENTMVETSDRTEQADNPTDDFLPRCHSHGSAVDRNFAAGFQQAYWLLLGFTALGMILALSLDEKKLGRVEG